ncbi:MAG: hypothetical protein ACTSU4_14600 [Promethearchaeota archaeon]
MQNNSKRNDDDLKEELFSLIKSENYVKAYFLFKKIPSFLRTNDHEYKKINGLILKSLPLEVLSDIKVFEKSLAEASKKFDQQDFQDALQQYENAMNLALKLDLKDQYQKLFEQYKLTQKLMIEKKKNKYKDVIPSKFKTILKKSSKIASKHVGDIAKEIVKDQVSNMTNIEELGDISGKVAGSLIKEGIKHFSRENVTEKNGLENAMMSSNGIIIQEKKGITPSNKEEIEKRILGIIIAKSNVKIKYITEHVNLTEKEIIGIIFDLIGSGIIKGFFNEDDSEFTLIDYSVK